MEELRAAEYLLRMITALMHHDAQKRTFAKRRRVCGKWAEFLCDHTPIVRTAEMRNFSLAVSAIGASR